jgi:alkylation response protein AidB-like acyl-CoA dehydrogenase
VAEPDSGLRWSEEQEQLASMLGSLLAKHSDSVSVRSAIESQAGYDEKLWSMLCEQVGIAGLAVPEEYGGAGFSFLETAVVLEQLGQALTPSPMLATFVATSALLHSGDTDASSRLLPSIAGGSVATLAWSGPSSTPGAEEPVTESGGRLTGTVARVLDGANAEVLLALARSGDGVGLFEVSPDSVEVERTPAMDPALQLATVTFDGVEGTRVGGADMTDALVRVHAEACAAVAALEVGVAQRALDMTVAYTKERQQFGRPIGSFQALKHRMADMLVLVETARSAAMDAAFGVAEDQPDVLRRTTIAKAYCSEALQKIAAETIQLHGGIAITWEHDAHLVFKRAHALSQLFGAPHLHRRSLLD